MNERYEVLENLLKKIAASSKAMNATEESISLLFAKYSEQREKISSDIERVIKTIDSRST